MRAGKLFSSYRVDARRFSPGLIFAPTKSSTSGWSGGYCHASCSTWCAARLNQKIWSIDRSIYLVGTANSSRLASEMDTSRFLEHRALKLWTRTSCMTAVFSPDCAPSDTSLDNLRYWRNLRNRKTFVIWVLVHQTREWPHDRRPGIQLAPSLFLARREDESRLTSGRFCQSLVLLRTWTIFHIASRLSSHIEIRRK